MFIESNAAYIMLVPLFAPIALAYQSDPVVLWLPARARGRHDDAAVGCFCS